MTLYLKFTRDVLKCRHTFKYSSFSGLNLWNEEISIDNKHKIEAHWREKLNKLNYNEDCNKRDKYYVLSMFPYPSGFLHMGHVRVYTISDAIARFQAMNGKQVIHPIGWDAFGLPAENAAIERQIAPDEWTKKNIKHMKGQLQQLGCSFDWHRELATCDPQYYKWTQNLFLKLYDSGLAYKKEAMVNWDPVDQTVLADEQVDENGCSWRSGATVEKKLLKQWFIRTTQYAKQLLDGLNDPMLQDWRDVIKLQQHWIGDCDGVSFDFGTTGSDEFVTLWTDKPEFINQAKFVAVNDKHIFATSKNFKVLDDDTRLLDIKLKNPISGDEIPVFVTSKIEFLPLTDSFVGIPGICEQSRVFAEHFKIQYTKLPTLTSEDRHQVQNQVCSQAQQLKRGGYWTSAKLRDWLISRQRFWGTPIPIIYCDHCGVQPVPREQLPVELPQISKLSQKGVSQLMDSDWVNVPCPKCGKAAKRETDTMDTFVDSSWYYLRYLDPRNDSMMFDKKKISDSMPVDLYIGGKEHAVLHLYYARFICHFLHRLGLVPEREPFKRLLVQGMVMGRSYRIKGSGEYVPEKDVKVIDSKKNKAILESTGQPVVMSWEKMSKSKHNGVDPEEMFKEYGVDTTRLLILADVAPTSHRNWNNNTFPGIINWQKRLWLSVREFLTHRSNPPPSIPDEEFQAHDNFMFDSRNYYLKGTTFNYCGSQQHSVAISKQQGLTNSLRKVPPVIFAKSLQFERALATQIILLAPMAPHFASELWSGFLSAPNRLSNSGETAWDQDVFSQKWPEVDSNYNLDLLCEVNGFGVCCVKMPRGRMEVLTPEEAIDIVLAEESVKEHLVDRTVLKTMYTWKVGYEGVVHVKTNFAASQDKEKVGKNKKKKVKN